MNTKTPGQPKTNSKTLVLYCMPLMERGVGSAWGLPVVAAGKERLSALSLSEKLEAPGALSISGNPLRAAQVEELEALGIGPLGRYIGGEPVKPVRVGPEDFFCRKKTPASDAQFRRTQSAAELFCTALEFDSADCAARWMAEGSAAELFHGHLEFLRAWGYSGGLYIERAALTPLLADYLNFLQKEKSCERAKIIVLMSKNFYEADLAAKLQKAKPYGDPAAGEIPVNYSSEGKAVLGADFKGLAIVLYEDLVPMLRAQKTTCDILITIRAGGGMNAGEDPSQTFSAGELIARLKLCVDAAKPPKQNGKTEAETQMTGIQKGLPVSAFLFRNLISTKNNHAARQEAVSSSAGNPAALPFPAIRKTGVAADWREWKKRRSAANVTAANAVSREEAAALGLLSQWEAGRVETAAGCLFAVNAKFSGLRAADFKEEQAQFYREAPRAKRVNQNDQIQPEGSLLDGSLPAGSLSVRPPPVRPGVRFSALNETQLEFFLRWRSECRRGFVPVLADSDDDRAYMESYVLLYANELALCMGREGPLRHFHSLICLFHACVEHLPETAALLCRLLVDFAVVYGIAVEALPLLLDELWNNGGFVNTRDNNESTALLIDLAVCHFFVEKPERVANAVPFETEKTWPLISALIPPKILARKENDKELPAQCCRTLALIDASLRQDWNRGFFSLFYPPLPVQSEYAAFEQDRSLGNSSYTVYRPGFSSHRPLLDILSALALEPGTNPLPGVKARLHPLSLENELLEELRQESDAVREILKTEADYSSDDLFEGEDAEVSFTFSRAGTANTGTAGARTSSAATTNARTSNDGTLQPQQKFLPEKNETAYTPPEKPELVEFIASLKETERNVIKTIAQKSSPEMAAHGSIPSSTAMPFSVSEAAIDAINGAFYERFGDLLIETGPEGPSISAEYGGILEIWETGD